MAATLMVLTVFVAGCARSGAESAPDYAAIPAWTEQYVRLAGSGDVEALQKFLGDSDSSRAQRLVAPFRSGHGWRIAGREIEPNGVSSAEREVSLRLRDAAGSEHSEEFTLHWIDGRWNRSDPVPGATLPPGAADVTPPTRP